MKEVKFKARRIDNKNWVYGYYIKHLPYTPSPIVRDVEQAKKELEKDYEHYIMYDGFSDWNMSRNTEHVQVIPETVCQYIGTKDNIELYENDRIEYEQYYEGDYKCNGDIGTIKWNDEELEYQLRNNKGKYLMSIDDLYKTRFKKLEE